MIPTSSPSIRTIDASMSRLRAEWSPLSTRAVVSASSVDATSHPGRTRSPSTRPCAELELLDPQRHGDGDGSRALQLPAEWRVHLVRAVEGDANHHLAER